MDQEDSRYGFASKFFQGSDDDEDEVSEEEIRVEEDVEDWEGDIMKELNQSIYKVAKQLKQDSGRNLYNRLQSIREDKDFVQKVKEIYEVKKFPLLANLRCGLWYFPKFDGTCYFKSTDGHVGKWQFNLSRLNLNVAELAGETRGCIIIDSTRKGKKFPDSFTRTIPIWCCTINSTLLEYKKSKNISLDGWNTDLHLPSWVSESEKSQVQALINGFATKLLSSGVDLSKLESKLNKPLKPYWIHRTMVNDISSNVEDFSSSFTPIILVSVSKTEEGTNEKGFSYIQGAGDDEESWAQGLTPPLFWKNEELILRAGFKDIETRVAKVIDDHESFYLKKVVVEITSEESSSETPITTIGNTNLAVGTSVEALQRAQRGEYEAVLNCSVSSYEGTFSNYLHLPVPEGKSDKNKLEKILPGALEFLDSQLKLGKKVLIHSRTGLDAPVCISLACLLSFFDFEGKILPTPRKQFTKDIIRKMYLYLDKFSPQSRPPKFMMNELNRYFMTPEHLKSKSIKKSENKS